MHGSTKGTTTGMKQQLFKVRDRRNKGWFFMDNEYLNGYARIFGPVGTAIYVSLCRHADNNQQCFPSMELMAEEIGASRNTISKYIKLFEAKHLISIEREINPANQRRMNNVYTLLDKTEWDVHAQQLGMESHAQLTTVAMHKSHAQQLCNKETIKNTNIKDTQEILGFDQKSLSSSSSWSQKTAEGQGQAPTLLPDWLNKEVWKEWVEYKKELKKPLSSHTIRLQLSELEKNKDNHVEMLEQSMRNGWQRFFPLEQSNENGKSNILKAKNNKYDRFNI